VIAIFQRSIILAAWLDRAKERLSRQQPTRSDRHASPIDTWLDDPDREWSDRLGNASRSAMLLATSLGVLAWAQDGFAYRPFDSTDAAVADLGELEVELGPGGFRRSETERTLIAPAVVLNYGFSKNWELVWEGQVEHPFAPAEDTRSRLVGHSLFLKGVLREGVLQDKAGPSIATEFGVLLPGLNDEQGVGASWSGIVSQRWSWGTIHFNVGAELTREQHGDVSVGTIVEGPYDWKVRPVAEVRYEREFNTRETLSGLVGLIWKVSDTLAFDIGLRHAWVNTDVDSGHHRETEIRAGLTFAISPEKDAAQRSSQSLRH
jgi:hypothetical protein